MNRPLKILNSNSLPNSFFEKAVESISETEKYFCYLSSHTDSIKEYPYLEFDKILALGGKKIITPNENKWGNFSELIKTENSWKFGFLSYDLKNELEDLLSINSDEVKFPELAFFIPNMVITQRGNEVWFYGKNKNQIDSFISKASAFKGALKYPLNKTNFESRTSKENYLGHINTLKNEIQLGNIYEINYCIEFFAKNYNLNILSLFHHFVKESEVPFGAFCRFNNHYVFSASPERFIKKQGLKIISQPIKGTSRRKEKSEFEAERAQLKNSLKDQTENVMIVDLVRNDLSKTAKRASVKVEELFGVYSFPTVHQLISTIVSEVDQSTNLADIIKSCFPMGSMTGAPKISAMQLAEKHEDFKRGLYSGAIGFVTPENNFDFNVVIRTAIFNSETNYLSYAVGGAITNLSNAEEEYQECLLKAERFLKLFH